jgi:hypothetical protein
VSRGEHAADGNGGRETGAVSDAPAATTRTPLTNADACCGSFIRGRRRERGRRALRAGNSMSA